MPTRPPIPRAVVPSVRPEERSPARVGRDFRALLASGAQLLPLGKARRTPNRLLRLGYLPRHVLRLFDASFYLSGPFENEDMRFFLAYVRLAEQGREARRIHPRIFYKDMSLVWRSASHYVRSARENWLGKGDLECVLEGGEERWYTNEATTDLPLEIQTALEQVLVAARKIPYDDTALHQVLRRAPDDRAEPYRDFTAPRRRAQADPRNLINRGRKVARFTRRNDPTSLRFAKGFEPDFRGGILERGRSTSGLYGGRLGRFRILSKNGEVQYLFFAGPRQAWIASVQATTTELSSYGVRTIDVAIDDDALLPGYEYHFMDEAEDPPVLHSQVPAGFAGEPSERDPYRVDTSAFLDAMPVIREFRKAVL